MKNIAPVVVYTYNRIEHLKQTISALKSNYLANETDLFVVSDGARNRSAEVAVGNIRDYVDSINGFNSVNKIFRDRNYGAFESITSAEMSVVSDYGRIISMEDDIVTSRNFLDFINAGLDFFENDDKVISISGYCHPIETGDKSDSWMNIWHCPWGYGTWKKKYSAFDYAENKYEYVLKNKQKNFILKTYGDFMIDTIQSDLRGEMMAADARVCLNMLLNENLTVMPRISKVKNIGCDGSGLHSGETNKFDVVLDDGLKRNFKFEENFAWSDNVFQNYNKFMNGNSIDRSKRKIKRIIKKMAHELRLLKNY